MRPGALEIRAREQAAVLDRAAALAAPGGRVAYITCSVLEAENGAQVRAFLAHQPGFTVVPPAETTGAALGGQADAFLAAALVTSEGVLMTPRRTETDGFFVSILRRTG
jgi:16S rRNA (cytosine967-C5)-methyltransferase